MNAPRYHILVIDDNETDRRLVERQLRKASAFVADVSEAGSHEEGLERLSRRDIDCVLLDYRLGAECGLETLEAIRRCGDDTAIVFVTGFGNEMVAVEALQRGAQDYLVKSVLAPEVLQRAILNAVEKIALSRQVREKQRELEDFVSVVAHDLQQPLCAVKGNVELIRDFYGESLGKQGMEFVDAAVRTSCRMAEMIEALLGYARAGRDRAPIANLDLNELAGGVKSDLAGLIAQSKATVAVEPLPAVDGDPVTLAQLFQNLIANAIKFHGEADPEIHIDGERQGDRVVLSVRDNGMGMPSHALEDVFAPFRRLPQAKDRPGSGIGLATCKKIAEQHRGRIWAESDLGVGSTFFIELRASTGGFAADPPAGALRVLLVDDEPSGSDAVARMLARHGIMTFPVANVSQAASLIERERFHAAVVDLTLSDGGAMDLIQHVRARYPGTAILAVTAGDGRSAPGPLLAAARRRGADHVLPKPLDGSQVAKVLRRMISETATPSAVS